MRPVPHDVAAAVLSIYASLSTTTVASCGRAPSIPRDAALDAFQYYKTHAETLHSAAGHKLQVMRSDNGGEFIGERFTAYLEQAGIRRQLTAPYTPSQNGVVERANRTIVEAVRTTLQASGLPNSFWAEAAAHAIFVRNRLPTKAVRRVTPYQAWNGRKPDADILRPFGCIAHAYIHAVHRNKLDAKSRRCVFVGFATDSAQYRLYDPATDKVFQSRDGQV